MPFDIKAFLAANTDKLSAEETLELERGFMRNEDYHRNFNKLKAEIDANDQYAADLKTYEETNAANQRRLALLEQRLGVPVDQLLRTADPSLLQSPTTGQYVKAADVEKLVEAANQKLLAQLAPAIQGTFQLAQQSPRLYNDYMASYGKPLDMAKFIEFCTTNGINDVDQGYKLFTTDDEKARLTEQHKKELVTAREEGAREFATTHHIPLVSVNSGPLRSPLFRQPTVVTPTAVVPPVVTVTPTPTPSALDTINANASALAAKIQADFQAALAK